MKSTGIQRKVDDLGRVVIPAGIRKSMGMREGDTVEVHVDGDKVVLTKPQDRCVFCEAELDLQNFRTKRVCRPCIASVGVMDEQIRATSRAEQIPAAEPGGVPSWNLEPTPRPTSTAHDAGDAAEPTPPPAVTAPAASAPATNAPATNAPATAPAAPRVHEPHRQGQPSRADEPASSTAW